MCKKIGLVFLIVVVILLLDQATKALIVTHMSLYQSEPVVASFFHLTYVRNTGAAFGFLAQTPAWFRQPFFLVVTGVAVFALGVFLRNADETDRMTNIAVATILGGALGNLIDRIQAGSVIDFIDLHWHGYHWPAFNVADTCITLGVIGLLWASFRNQRIIPSDETIP